MYIISRKTLLASLAMTCSIAAFAQQPKRDGDPALTEVWLNEPAVVTPGANSSDAPSDAIILFDGKDASKWTSKSGGNIEWKVENGAMTVVGGKGMITSKESFGDMQMHIEWRTPAEVKGESQGRGNSGIFIMGLYELQVLDNYNNRTYSNGQAGSIYKQLIPLANACRKPGEWQTYDVVFTAPRFAENGMVKTPARITIIHNGVLVQNNATIVGATEYIGIPVYQKHADKLPISLQDHGNPVSFRNIWVRNL
jgi:hypothetical protein